MPDLETLETGIVSKTAAEAKFPSPGFLCTKFSALQDCNNQELAQSHGTHIPLRPSLG